KLFGILFSSLPRKGGEGAWGGIFWGNRDSKVQRRSTRMIKVLENLRSFSPLDAINRKHCVGKSSHHHKIHPLGIWKSPSTADSSLPPLLFLLFLVIYIVTVTGNFLIIALVVADQHLHILMYFLLGNLSWLLASLLTPDGTISVKGCIVQLYFFGIVDGFKPRCTGIREHGHGSPAAWSAGITGGWWI
uniref:G-protein coupled receptors family 1 profile domain-containing protein n=1 Tax=Chrysemys picta bellii TaxID=8478 RepID=A0A8C3IAV6_CHRPI